MARLFGNDPRADQFADNARRVSEQIETLWPRCAKLGVDVILDLNFWSREQRDRTRAIAASIGADAKLYRLACSDEEAWQRIEKRNQALSSGLFIAKSTFEALKARFEPLKSDEDRIDIAADGCREGR
jgi:predicted kinase